MPIYEYKCSNCGHFEQKQGIKDKPLTQCPTCDGPVQRLISKT
ncbi:MAG TPA: FmdB family transcriptional regulator, partial [Firmicutes bacterium]|nr:FmdB family transcriptional regulator [Bacillota bacterium]